MAEMALDLSNQALSGLAHNLARIMGGSRQLALVAPLGGGVLRMSAYPPDLHLGGHTARMTRRTSMSGVLMLSPTMTLEADDKRAHLLFRGRVLVPFTAAETLRFQVLFLACLPACRLVCWSCPPPPPPALRPRAVCLGLYCYALAASTLPARFPPPLRICVGGQTLAGGG